MMRYNTEFKEVKGVGRIPVDWEVSLVNDIANVIDSLHETPKYSDNGYKMIRVNDIREGALDTCNAYMVNKDVYEKFSKKYKPKKHDVVLSRVGSYGVSAYIDTDEDICLGQNIVVINTKINPKYLYYNLNTKCIKQQIERVVVGSSQKTLSLENIKNLIINVPPEKEQEKIAQILFNVDMNIEKTEQAIYKYKQVKKGLMDDLLTGKIRIKDGKRFKETRFKDVKGIGKIPLDWEVKELDEVTNINSSALSENTDTDLELNYIDIESVTTGKIKKIKLVKFKNAPSRARRIVIEKDVIVSTVRPYLKAFALIRESKPNLICSTGFAVLRTKERLNPMYLYQYTLTDLFIEQLNNKMVGSNYPAVNSTDLRETLIIYPSNIEEQLIIAKVFSRQDEIIDKEEKYLEKLKKLKLGLVEDLLIGKVRVNMDI